MPRDITLRSLQRSARKIVRELEQQIRDKEWWNNNRLDAEPFDVGVERIALKHARNELQALLKGDTHSGHMDKAIEALEAGVAADREDAAC